MKTHLRIGVVAPEFPPALGGMEIYACEVVKQLAARGHEVTVFTKPHDRGEVQIEGVRVLPVLRAKRSLDEPALVQHATGIDMWHVMNAAYAWVALSFEPVVLSVYGNDFINPNPVVRWDIKRRLRLPVGDRLDLAVARWRTRRTLDHALHRVHHVITISNFSRDLFLDAFPHCGGKVTVAYLGVSDSFFDVERPARAGGRKELLTVCRLSEPRKSVDQVLRALAELKSQHDFHYRVVGDGPLRPQLEALARELGVADRVTFDGFVDSSVLKRRLAEADLFILTSALRRDTVEGFGIVYLEANACGTPVLAARLGGAAEAVEEGVSGMFVEHPEPMLIAERLRGFLSGGVAFPPEGCRAFANRFRWERVVEQMVEHYPKPILTTAT